MTLLPVQPGVAAGTTPGAAQSPGSEGRPLFVTNSRSDTIAGFTVGEDGSPVSNGSPVPTEPDGGPSGIVMAPDGHTAYVANRTAGTVLAFAVGKDGTLAPVSDPEPTGGKMPFGMALAPDGRTLYVSNIQSSTISVFAVGDDGTLALSGDPIPTESVQPRGLAITPDGRFLYVGHGIPLADPTNDLDRYAIEADGSLSAPRTVATIGGAGTGMGITPDGRFLYVATTNSDQLFGFSIGADGDLTGAPGSPYAVPDHAEGIALSPDGRFLFLASAGQVRPDTNRAVSAFTVGDDGALDPVAGSPFEAGAGPVGIAVTPDGRFLYVSHFDGDEVYGFAIAPDGTLTRTAGSPVPSGGHAPAFMSLAIVPDQGPMAALSTAPATVKAGHPVRLNATASTDPDGAIARYDWDFGDGTVLRDAGPRTRHVYSTSGTFTAEITVTDDEGCSTTRVFTGQLALCNGSHAATATATVTVR